MTKELFRSEYRPLLNQARDLRRELQRRRLDTGDVDKAMRSLEELVDGSSYDDKVKAEQLEAAVIEQLKALEFSLRRQIEKESLRPALGGNSDVPAEYKPLVAEYYRTLADRP